MSAPVGAVVRIFYDARRAVLPGDHLVTPTGRTYEIASVRVQARGRHAGRMFLACIVRKPGADLAPGKGSHPLFWYARGRRRANAEVRR